MLKDRLIHVFNEDASEIEPFLTSNLDNVPEQTNTIKKCIPLLLKHGYISISNSNIPSRGSLLGVKAINFELTYKCTSNCSHCLQKNIRQTCVTQLSTKEVKNTILEAYLSGLCTYGINFTGGEVLGNRDDLFEILKYTYSLKIPFRINSNSWWSRNRCLDICHVHFTSALDLVRYLKTVGLTQFAFSYDDRLYDLNLMKNLVEAIKICERTEVNYQVIFTGIDPEEIGSNLTKLRKEISSDLNYLILVSMEMVDIGGASDLKRNIYERQSNKSTCENKGFYHPEFLHISPDGKVRTCMYAVGLADVGNLSQITFTDMVNRFPYNKYSEIFANENKRNEAFEKLVLPYLPLYKPVIHECTKNVILAKTIESYYKNQVQNLEAIHKVIMKELNLSLERK